MPDISLLFTHVLTGSQTGDTEKKLNPGSFYYMPKELIARFNTIYPNISSLSRYFKPFKYLINIVRKVDYLLINGIYGSVYLMVDLCFSRGIILICSTLKRVSKKYVKISDAEIKEIFTHIILRRH